MSIPITSSVLNLSGQFLQNVNLAGGVIGPPPTGSTTWGRNNILSIENTDTLNTAIDKIITFVEDSTLNTPSNDIRNVTETILSMNLYSAKSAMTGTTLQCIDQNKPQTLNPQPIFYDNGGTLTVIVVYANNTILTYDNSLINTQMNSTLLTPIIPVNNTGVKNFLTIQNDQIYNGVYSLDLFIGGNSINVPILNAGPSVFSYQLKQVNTSNISYLSNILSFSVDNPITPSVNVNNPYGITSITSSGITSGIPCLKFNDLITCTFQPINCIRSFYNVNYLAKLSGNNIVNDVLIQAPTFIPVTPGVIPINGVISSGGITNTNPIIIGNCNLKDNTFFDNITPLTIDVTVQNSKSVQSTNVLVSRIGNIICDTLSFKNKSLTFINENYVNGEINRVPSGINLYPNYGLTINDFSDTIFNVNTDNNSTKELILFNGKYQYLTGINYNFTTSNPVGPDYSNLLPDTTVISMPNLRWVTFAKQFPNNVNFTRINFTITTDGINWNSIDDQANSPIVSNIQILATIRNGIVSMPWFDCNKAGINPQNTGDGCLDVANSTLFEKNISTGLRIYRNGTVFIRIGLPIGMSLNGISIQ